MPVLAIDTSEAWCSAALVAYGAALAVRREHLGRGHAERLMPMIEELLLEAGLTLADVTRLAVVTGPGTFTGLRIGLSVARGLGLALGRPVLGFTGFPLVAGPYAGANTGVIHAVIDGRGGQAFHQSFQGLDETGFPIALDEGSCHDVAEIQKRIDAAPGLVVGSGAPLVGGEAGFGGIDPVWLGSVAARLDPALHLPEPTYFRPPDAKKSTPLFPVAV